jgi:indole-3-glycerol phosphate synthase
MKAQPPSDGGTAPGAMTFLEEILSSTRDSVQSAKRGSTLSELKKRARDREPPRGFAVALSNGTDLKLIAEVKQASPSRGVLRHPFDPVEIARIYEEEGAAAVSILTEERFFRGSLEHLRRVRGVIKLPLLRKDFVIDEYQVYEARVFDADAVLLIAAILDDSRLKDYQSLAWELGMAGLVEVHTELEKERALGAGARIIGINNRDLSTFKTDLETTFRLIRDIPDDRIVISESGIADRKDVERIRESGTDAVLIGESLITSPDIRLKIQGLFGR